MNDGAPDPVVAHAFGGVRASLLMSTQTTASPPPVRRPIAYDVRTADVDTVPRSATTTVDTDELAQLASEPGPPTYAQDGAVISALTADSTPTA